MSSMAPSGASGAASGVKRRHQSASFAGVNLFIGASRATRNTFKPGWFVWRQRVDAAALITVSTKAAQGNCLVNPNYGINPQPWGRVSAADTALVNGAYRHYLAVVVANNVTLNKATWPLGDYGGEIVAYSP